MLYTSINVLFPTKCVVYRYKCILQCAARAVAVAFRLGSAHKPVHVTYKHRCMVYKAYSGVGIALQLHCTRQRYNY